MSEKMCELCNTDVATKVAVSTNGSVHVCDRCANALTVGQNSRTAKLITVSEWEEQKNYAALAYIKGVVYFHDGILDSGMEFVSPTEDAPFGRVYVDCVVLDKDWKVIGSKQVHIGFIGHAVGHLDKGE